MGPAVGGEDGLIERGVDVVEFVYLFQGDDVFGLFGPTHPIPEFAFELVAVEAEGVVEVGEGEGVEPLLLSYVDGLVLGGGGIEPGGAELVKLARGRGDSQDARIISFAGFVAGGPGEGEGFKGGGGGVAWIVAFTQP